ncbi:TIGR03915 family putative DNA repair protein [Bacilliculturomica massiliensis]|uniref:TIGR03915 family putative DNA repair protein n=1 Tax=Bacilliculturomica massiliensis TaxID=1917867 RepID=UPI001031C277|nr:TIGR03915 family putative DNA repair protein [Bacilliculturomica massiliensis]
MDYLYDGSFEGVLCCIYAHYYGEKAEGIFEKSCYQQNMLRQFRMVETDGDKAARVYDAIRGKISSDALRRVYAVYLCTEPEKEMKILRYVELGFRMGAKVDLMHADPVVFDAQQAEKKVYAERHRYLGILRFSVIRAGGAGMDEGDPAEVLYARLEPDNDVVELMAPHFADRYKNDPFILHDLRREKAVFSQGGHWYVAVLPKDAPVDLAQGEREYRKLWKQYFETIAIRERINPRCQKQYMPVRYWKHLTEMFG